MMFSKDNSELCGFDKKPCIRQRCVHWIRILGNHPQTGQPIDHWNCTFSWQSLLMVENSQMQRQTAAAVESARNENVHAMAGIAVCLNELREQQRKGAAALTSMLDLAKETRRLRDHRED